eukprot:TRINITY_DN100509_c0_g1_i1.p1 TRINITY_DN100509_c0_g1~~TRINITY_DN100509_c0_g1_i1.p1  ORF type:complete len:102 (-),score=4.12 TRINITY_DN100509_c0_g1_i1:8-313(-)
MGRCILLAGHFVGPRPCASFAAASFVVHSSGNLQSRHGADGLRSSSVRPPQCVASQRCSGVRMLGTAPVRRITALSTEQVELEGNSARPPECIAKQGSPTR